MYSEKTRLGEVLKNPFGRDVLMIVSANAGIDRAAIESPIARAMTLGSLKKLSKGLIDDALIATLCEKLSEYDAFPPVKHPDGITPKWWKEAVFYQIYPSSFKDSDGDGIGDLQGVISKLDYLKELGVTALWLCPVYKSPWDDNGYDIADYRAIRPEFGTLADMDELLKKAHERGIRVIMDLVVNHTSDEHEWFESAKQSLDSPYRDYYVFQEGDGSTPPNNWQSMFSGSAWNYYPQTKSYALHTFSKKQMDLNWRNDKVRREVADIVNFWYDRGVDGFRLDVINMIDKPASLPDGSEAIGQLMNIRGVEHYFFGSRAHEYLHELNCATTEGRDVFTVGEMPAVGMELSRLFTDEKRRELDMVFSFDHLYEGGRPKGSAEPFSLEHFKNTLVNWQENYGNACWPSLFSDNHDNPRMLSRIDPREEYRLPLSKLLATVLLTLKGTPFIYEGQELGMTNCEFYGIDDFRDVETLNYYREHKGEQSDEELLAFLRRYTRDHARTPMQWNKDGGFTTGTPWIKMNDNCKTINAADEQTDPISPWSFYKHLIKLRKSSPALVYGEFVPVNLKKGYFCYERKIDGEQFYIEMNLLPSSAKKPRRDGWELVLSNYDAPVQTLRPYEANIYKKPR